MHALRVAAALLLTAPTLSGAPAAADPDTHRELAVLDAGSTWAYRTSDTAPAGDWTSPGYPDQQWPRGPAPLGYGDPDRSQGTSLPPGSTTTYFRTTITVDDPAEFTGLRLSALIDDGAVVYLNGTEVWRTANVPTGQTHTTWATRYIAGNAETTWTHTNLAPTTLTAGANTVAVEVHQHSPWSSDLHFDLQLHATTRDGSAEPPTQPAPIPVCQVSDPRLREISGLTASVRHPHILWTHNDSGDANRIYALDTRTCAVRATLTLAGAHAYDYESISMGRGPGNKPVIWVGDTGDNSHARPHIELYRFDEPAELVDQDVTVTAVTVTWDQGARDCEAMIVDPTPDGPVYLISKQAQGGIHQLRGAFRATGHATTGTAVSDTLNTATDAAIAPDRSASIIRNYQRAQLYPGAPGHGTPQDLALPSQRQGEAITFSADSRALWLASEGAGQRLYRIPLP